MLLCIRRVIYAHKHIRRRTNYYIKSEIVQSLNGVLNAVLIYTNVEGGRGGSSNVKLYSEKKRIHVIIISGMRDMVGQRMGDNDKNTM